MFSRSMARPIAASMRSVRSSKMFATNRRIAAFKIYIIDEVHQVTKDAFNALLENSGGAAASVKFILATTEPHRLPETILSRCQRYDFRRISLREIVQRLGDNRARAKVSGI